MDAILDVPGIPLLALFYIDLDVFQAKPAPARGVGPGAAAVAEGQESRADGLAVSRATRRESLAMGRRGARPGDNI